MDPHISPEQPGLSTDLSKSDDAVNYLRRLKGPVTEGMASGAAGRGDGKTGGSPLGPGFKDRRQSPRLRCSGSVEFRVESSDVRMWGTLTDISLHGCYVEMNATFPVDTNVDLVMTSFGIRIHTAGRVRATYPSLGMGICFADIEPAEQLQLKQLLAALSGRSTIYTAKSPEEVSMKEILMSADPRTILGEVMGFFRNNQLLSHAEFYQIAKRARRS
ncbi:MAG: PilZ domain-containing protein [Acidobacteriia bacterium]|nr:PilZ domain-containing protein [Terriglobia bacterium]